MSIITIKCGCCGKIEAFEYTATNVNQIIGSGWNSFGDTLYCPKCVCEEKRGAKKPFWGEVHTASQIDYLAYQQHNCTVIEVCSNCGIEIEMRWNVERDGYKAFCPVCGERLMLCDECHHRNGEFHDDCNYNCETDSCRFNPIEVKE